MNDQKLTFTFRFLLLGNLALALWVFIAFLSIFIYSAVYGWIYLFVVVTIVYLIMRRLGCSSCYRCKSCTSGFGRLAGAFFGKGYTKKESVGNRLSLVILVYMLLTFFPTVCLILAISNVFFPFRFMHLIALWAVTTYSIGTWF